MVNKLLGFNALLLGCLAVIAAGFGEWDQAGAHWGAAIFALLIYQYCSDKKHD